MKGQNKLDFHADSAGQKGPNQPISPAEGRALLFGSEFESRWPLVAEPKHDVRVPFSWKPRTR